MDGLPSADVQRWSYLNAAFQTGLPNPLDEAILTQPHPDTTGMDKLEEIPYDFTRKRLSIVVDSDPGTEVRPMLITKGALDHVLAVCSRVLVSGAAVPLDQERLSAIEDRYAAWSRQGYRVLGVAVREVPRKDSYSVEADERDLAFAGFLLFFDPPKPDARDTLESLRRLGR